MKVYLSEIKEVESEFSFDQSTDWVCRAISAADEKSEDPRRELRPAGLSRPSPSFRPSLSEYRLQQVDDVFVVNGHLKTSIHLTCSRCTGPVELPIDTHFCALFTQVPEMAGVTGNVDEDKRAVGHNQSSKERVALEGAFTGTPDEITYLKENFIDLEEVLREQALLQVPYAPICRSDCKGMCPQCGADLNAGRCACKQIPNESPFGVLQGLKNRFFGDKNSAEKSSQKKRAKED